MRRCCMPYSPAFPLLQGESGRQRARTRRLGQGQFPDREFYRVPGKIVKILAAKTIDYKILRKVRYPLKQGFFQPSREFLRKSREFCFVQRAGAGRVAVARNRFGLPQSQRRRQLQLGRLTVRLAHGSAEDKPSSPATLDSSAFGRMRRPSGRGECVRFLKKGRHKHLSFLTDRCH